MATLGIVLALCGLALVGYSWIRIIEAPNTRPPSRKKYVLENKELKAKLIETQQENERLRTENLARRNGLPWVDIED